MSEAWRNQTVASADEPGKICAGEEAGAELRLLEDRNIKCKQDRANGNKSGLPVLFFTYKNAFANDLWSDVIKSTF